LWLEIETVEVYQLEFVIELKNGAGAADNHNSFFFLKYTKKVYLPLILKSY
jgi:hypothetical protein